MRASGIGRYREAAVDVAQVLIKASLAAAFDAELTKPENPPLCLTLTSTAQRLGTQNAADRAARKLTAQRDLT
jgi:hypothetical protein